MDSEVSAVSEGVARNPYSKRPSDLELEVFETVWRRYKRGARDIWKGGVAPRDIADDIGGKVGSVSRVCDRLRDEDVFVELNGAKPAGDYAARRSYAPAALYEGGDGQ